MGLQWFCISFRGMAKRLWTWRLSKGLCLEMILVLLRGVFGGCNGFLGFFQTCFSGMVADRRFSGG